MESWRVQCFCFLYVCMRIGWRDASWDGIGWDIYRCILIGGMGLARDTYWLGIFDTETMKSCPYLRNTGSTMTNFATWSSTPARFLPTCQLSGVFVSVFWACIEQNEKHVHFTRNRGIHNFPTCKHVYEHILVATRQSHESFWRKFANASARTLHLNGSYVSFLDFLESHFTNERVSYRMRRIHTSGTCQHRVLCDADDCESEET